jgi:ABC-type Fe3+/spermidine/putrescine transport system ATPase subunit
VTHGWRLGEKILQDWSEPATLKAKNWSGYSQRADFLGLLQKAATYQPHDKEYALAVADWVVVVRNGRMIQTGTPEDIYFRPKTAFVASFFGDPNLIPAHELEKSPTGLDVISAEQLRLAGPGATTSAQCRVLELEVNDFEYLTQDYLVKGCSKGTRVLEPAPICFHTTQRPQLGETVTIELPAKALLPIMDDRT